MNFRTFFSTILLFAIFFCLISCNNSTPPPLNPNGDSELAMLMREMFEEGMQMKEQLKKGIKPRVNKKFAAIHTAEATEPKKVATQEYKTFADSYLSTLDAFANADPLEAKEVYHGMVESCINCHKAMCPGPVVKIKKMYLPKGSDVKN